MKKEKMKGRVVGGYEESNPYHSRTEGGDTEHNGMAYDDCNKRQNSMDPMGHGEALSMARRQSNMEASPAKNGDHSGNRGHAQALAMASRESGQTVGGPETYGDDSIYESDLRYEAGKAASKMAMKGSRNDLPGVGEKAAGYRITKNAKPAMKAKRQAGGRSGY